MAQYDGSIRINTNIDTRGLRQGEGEIRSSLERMSSVMKKFAGVIATTFAVGKLVQFGKAALQTASDFEAMEAQFSQVFGNLEADASKSLSGIAKQAGIAEERMKSSYTKIAAFAKTTGMDTASSMELANRAMVVVADSAAFYDRSLEETTESLQSFLKGNYENDAALGLSATEFTRNAAANKLYGKSFQDLSEAQKQLTLLQMVEDANQLSGAMGQAAREADTWTNQIGNLKQAWSNLMASIGKIVLPVAIQAVKFIANVINSLSAMISKLSAAAGAFRSFSELLTGKKASGGNGVGNVASSGGITEAADGYNAAADAAENLAGSTEKAAKATKDAQKAAEGYLSPLDEINKISKESDVSTPDTGGAGGIGGGVGGAVGDIDYGNLAEGESIIDKMSDSLSGVIDRVRELAGLFKKGFFEGLGDYRPRLEDLKNDILSIGRTLKEIFTDPEVVSAANRFSNQLSYTLGQISGSFVSIGLTIAQNIIGGIEKYLTQNASRIKDYLVEMFDIGTEIAKISGNFSVAFADIFSVFGGDIAQQISGNIIGMFAEVGMMVSENAAKLGRDILNMIAQPIIDNKEKIKTALEGTLQAIEPFTSGLLTIIQTVRDAVSKIYDEHLKPLFDSITEGLTTVLGKLLDGYNQYIVPVLQSLGDRFSELMAGPLGETIDKISVFIGKIIDSMKLLWEEVLVPFFSWIADNIMPIIAPIAEFIGTNLLNKIETMIKVIGDIFDVLNGLIDFIVGSFTGDWEKSWEGIKQVFSGIINAILDIVKGKWENIKNIINTSLKLISSLINAAWNAIKSITLTIWNAIKSNVSTTWNGIKSIASTAFSGIKTVISTIWNALKSLSSSVWNGIKSALSSVWNGIKSVASSAFGGIKNAIVSAWNFVKTSTSNIWNGIANAVKAPINAIIGFINRMISGIASGVNSISNMVNSIGFDIPDWLGGGSWHPNLPTWTPGRIPYLATGTVVPPNREFMAVLGDNKREPEIVSPLSTMKQANRESLLEVLSELGLMGGGISKGNTYNIKALAHSKVLFELMIEEGKIQQMSTGRNPFMLGTT